MKWRADIDGLRAVAVWAVIFSHAKFNAFEGGYIGVDVFFVISGFLITQILQREFLTDSFSLIQFYDRRIRRIFPALFVMLTVVALISSFILLPLDFKEFGESLAATSLFLSNAYFSIKSGYFANNADYQPLLHTWSLGVEEQFYIFFPMFCYLILKLCKKRLKLAFAILWMFSFLLSINLFFDFPDKQLFYMPWFRGWEFLTGSLIATGVGKVLLQRFSSEVLSFGGLLLIMLPILLYSKETPFPGLTALPPVMGTALIILSGFDKKTTFVAKLLCLPFMRYMGKISYSLYLWHWPPLVFVFYLSNGDSSLLLNTLAICFSVVIASMSYSYVETPFRNRSFLSKRVVFGSSVFLIICSMAFGIAARIGNGLPQRLPADVAQISEVALDINPKRKQCDRKTPMEIKLGEVCKIGDVSTEPNFAVIGDSFGDAFIPGFNYLGQHDGHGGLVYTYSGCYPLIGTTQGNGKCSAFYSAALNDLYKKEYVETVFLVARWTSAIEASRVGFNTRNDMFLTSAEDTELSIQTTRKVFMQGLRRMLDRLKNKKVYLVAFIPEQHTNVPRTYGLAKLLDTEVDASVSKSSFDRRQKATRQILKQVSDEYGVSIIDVSVKLCDELKCSATKNGLPLYVDDNHISSSTAIDLSSLFKSAIN